MESQTQSYEIIDGGFLYRETGYYIIWRINQSR